MHTVRIKQLYWDIAADIHFPPGFSATNKYPAIICAHPIGSCKEQTSGNVYGQALAREGFVVIAFDASFQGDSGGEPRFIENPHLRVADFSAVADYLVTLDYVDAERIGVLGICGGGGYSVNAAMTERRIKAVGTVAGANYGRVIREGSGTGSPIDTLEAVARQRTAEARGAAAQIVNLLPSSPEEAARAGITDIDLYQATEYYRTPRGQKPNGATSVNFSSLGPALGWDAFHLAEVLLTQPLLAVVGDQPGAFGSYRDGFEIVGRARSTQKELVVLKEVSHYDLYWKPEAVAQALAKLAPFYKAHL